MDQIPVKEIPLPALYPTQIVYYKLECYKRLRKYKAFLPLSAEVSNLINEYSLIKQKQQIKNRYLALYVRIIYT